MAGTGIIIKTLTRTAFVLIFSMIFALLQSALQTPRTTLQRWNQVYENNNVDVLLVGNSQIFCGLNPTLIEHQGLRSYILASPTQNVIQTSYNLKEVFKHQSPRVVVMELSVLFFPEEDDARLAHKYQNLDGMRFSMNKVRAALTQVPPKHVPEALFPLLREHHRWKIAGGAVWKRDRNRLPVSAPDGGYFRILETYDIAPEKAESIQAMVDAPLDGFEPAEISAEALKHFQRIVRLCEARDIALWIVRMPTYGEWQPMSLAGEKLAKKYALRFIDYNRDQKRLQLGVSHYRDEFHLNFEGSVRVTTHLTRVLAAHFGKRPLSAPALRAFADSIAWHRVAKERIERGENGNFAFTVELLNQEDLRFSFVLQRDGEEVSRRPYGKDNVFYTQFTKPGTYRVQYIMQRAGEDRFGTSRVFGFFDEVGHGLASPAGQKRDTHPRRKLRPPIRSLTGTMETSPSHTAPEQLED